MRQSDVFKVCGSLLATTNKREYLEGQSRTKNLVINGIAESPNETCVETEEKVKTILSEKLNLQHEVEMERAHRTGKVGT